MVCYCDRVTWFGVGSFVVDAFCGCVLDLVGCFVFCGVVAWWLFCAFVSGCFAVCVWFIVCGLRALVLRVACVAF